MKPTNKPPVSNETRRRFIRAGLATGPVIMTLSSPSVFAADCVAPSATLSAAQSHRASQVGTNNGARSCDTWKTQSSTYKNNYFHDCFTQQSSATGCRMYKTDSSTGIATKMTFGEVLALSNTSTDVQLTRQFAAAYLNIMEGYVLFPVGGVSDKSLCISAIQDMWSERVTNGGYRPYAGATMWDNTKMTSYLTNFVPS